MLHQVSPNIAVRSVLSQTWCVCRAVLSGIGATPFIEFQYVDSVPGKSIIHSFFVGRGGQVQSLRRLPSKQWDSSFNLTTPASFASTLSLAMVPCSFSIQMGSTRSPYDIVGVPRRYPNTFSSYAEGCTLHPKFLSKRALPSNCSTSFTSYPSPPKVRRTIFIGCWRSLPTIRGSTSQSYDTKCYFRCQSSGGT